MHSRIIQVAQCCYVANKIKTWALPSVHLLPGFEKKKKKVILSLYQVNATF